MTGAPGDIIRITGDPLDPAALADEIRNDRCGAIASFVGVVRNHHQGRRVDHLVYEAYPPMAEAEMRRIAAEARRRWDVERMAMVHRVGRLDIGEASVAIVVAAAHRREALEACGFGIEELKRSVPIWKKEFGEGGATWIIGEEARDISE